MYSGYAVIISAMTIERIERISAISVRRVALQDVAIDRVMLRHSMRVLYMHKPRIVLTERDRDGSVSSRIIIKAILISIGNIYLTGVTSHLMLWGMLINVLLVYLSDLTSMRMAIALRMTLGMTVSAGSMVALSICLSWRRIVGLLALVSEVPSA